jgi:hypothetical protein
MAERSYPLIFLFVLCLLVPNLLVMISGVLILNIPRSCEVLGQISKILGVEVVLT